MKGGGSDWKRQLAAGSMQELQRLKATHRVFWKSLSFAVVASVNAFSLRRCSKTRSSSRASSLIYEGEWMVGFWWCHAG